MKIPLLALAAILLLPLNAGAQKIYKTTDEQGNTVFTDAPPTEEAKPVQLESSNIADSVEVRPPEPEPTPQARSSITAESPQDTPVYVGGDDDLREDVYEAHRKRELLDRGNVGEKAPEHLPADRPTARPSPAGHPARGRR